MSKPRPNAYQFNVKLTAEEYDKLQLINDKHFKGELTHTQLGRFLFDVAADYLASAKIEKREVVMINGVPLTEIK